MMQNPKYMVERDAFINRTYDVTAGPLGPLTLCWNITYDCNMACPHCMAPSARLGGPTDHRSVLEWLREENLAYGPSSLVKCCQNSKQWGTTPYLAPMVLTGILYDPS